MDGCTMAFSGLHQKRGFARPSGQAKPLNMFENGGRLFYNYLSAADNIDARGQTRRHTAAGGTTYKPSAEIVNRCRFRCRLAVNPSYRRCRIGSKHHIAGHRSIGNSMLAVVR